MTGGAIRPPTRTLRPQPAKQIIPSAAVLGRLRKAVPGNNSEAKMADTRSAETSPVHNGG